MWLWCAQGADGGMGSSAKVQIPSPKRVYGVHSSAKASAYLQTCLYGGHISPQLESCSPSETVRISEFLLSFGRRAYLTSLGILLNIASARRSILGKARARRNPFHKAGGPPPRESFSPAPRLGGQRLCTVCLADRIRAHHLLAC